MLKVKEKINLFFDSRLFPIIIAALVLAGHINGELKYYVLTVAMLTSLGFIVCKDLKFFISPLLYFYFIISKPALKDQSLYSEESIRFFAICIAILVLSIIAHFVLYRKELSITALKSSKLLIGFVAFAAVLILNGILAFDIYNKVNITFGVLIAVSFLVPFLLFSVNLRMDEKTVDYLIFVMMLASVIVSIEFLNLFRNPEMFQNGVISKPRMELGWGASNNIGGFLAMIVPVYFYKALKSKYCTLYFAGGVITYLLVVLTMSRASILMLTLVLAPCIVYSCIRKGDNRRMLRILTLLVSVAGIGILIILKDKLIVSFKIILDAGFSDSGRFEYYIDGFNKFLEHPILGAGFGNSHGVNDSFVIAAPEYFHNTLIQMLASCGFIGFIAYAYHRYETVKLFVKNKAPLSFFMGMCILILLLTSLLDIHMFNIFPAFYYSLILCILERHSKEVKCVADTSNGSSEDN